MQTEQTSSADQTAQIENKAKKPIVCPIDPAELAQCDSCQ